MPVPGQEKVLPLAFACSLVLLSLLHPTFLKLKVRTNLCQSDHFILLSSFLKNFRSNIIVNTWICVSLTLQSSELDDPYHLIST